MKKYCYRFCVLAFLASNSFSASFDPVADFSLASNPNGVWSYGSSPTPTGTFSLLTNAESPISSPFQFWSTAPLSEIFPSYYPLVRYNATGTDYSDASGFFVPVDRISLEPNNNSLAVLRFTAPTSGSYSIAGSFLGLQLQTTSPATNAAVFITTGSSILFNENVVNTDVLADLEPFNFVRFLNAGETLDFRVATNDTLYGDSVGLKLTIEDTAEPVGEIPEPLTAILVGCGLAFVVQRRKIQA